MREDEVVSYNKKFDKHLLYRLCDGEYEMLLYANRTQANNKVSALQLVGISAHVTVSRPFLIVIDEA